MRKGSVLHPNPDHDLVTVKLRPPFAEVAIGQLGQLCERIDHPQFQELLVTLQEALKAGFLEWLRR